MCAATDDFQLIRRYSYVQNPFLKNRTRYIILLLALPASLLFYACSQHGTSWYSRNFHNLTARDNAYYWARENMKETEALIQEGLKDDYDEILDVVYRYDTNQTKSIAQLQSVLKFASLPPTRHQNSNYVNVSYLLIGKALMYQGKWKDGMQAFKYVNSKSEDPDDRHAALIQLMRGYVRMKRYKDAMVVNDFIKKELGTLNENNERDYYLTLAQYHKELDHFAECRAYLDKAMPMVKKRYPIARNHFILGQLDQALGKDSSAYAHYQKTLKKNPPYILDFNTRLNMAQVTATHDPDVVKRTENYLKRMLNDRKNEEFKDRIYYEMGLFELKQKDEASAIDYFNKSLRISKGNTIQQGRTYLKLAQIYDAKEDYVTAKFYYDSTLSKWNKEDKEYIPIDKRHAILEEFSGYYLTVKREDSLQHLATMDSAKLSRYVDTLIAQEKIRIKNEQIAKEKEKNRTNTAVSTDPDSPTNPQDDLWYFYNPILLRTAKSDFVAKWGVRPLEDNWRRSTKEAPVTFEKDTTQQNPTNVVTNVKPEEIEIDKSSYYKDIPFTAEQKELSNKKIKDGLFNMGRLYDLKLDNDRKAIATYEELLRRFPEFEKTPEVLYSLCLLCERTGDKAKYDLYRNRLLSQYPHSIPAKLLLDPDYMAKHKEANAEAGKHYKVAFDYYSKKEYVAADSVIQTIRLTFPDNDLEDKMTMLEILMAGRQRKYDQYEQQLNDFIKKYPDSPLAPRAKDMLAAVEKQRSGATGPAPATDPTTAPTAPANPTTSPYPFADGPMDAPVDK